MIGTTARISQNLTNYTTALQFLEQDDKAVEKSRRIVQLPSLTRKL